MSESGNTYFGLWNLAYQELKESLTAQQAADRDKEGKEYWVLVGDPNLPKQVIRFSENRVNVLVAWLDSELREVLTYLFVPRMPSGQPGSAVDLFLEQVHFSEYDSTGLDSYQPSRAGASFFKPDGSAYHTQDLGDGPVEGRTGPMDPAEAEQLLFEPNPTFGDWDSIARRER